MWWLHLKPLLSAIADNFQILLYTILSYLLYEMHTAMHQYLAIFKNFELEVNSGMHELKSWFELIQDACTFD